MPTRVIVLAAGLGKRMNSRSPKVLHSIAGKSMIEHVLDAAEPLSEKPPIVVHGLNGDVLKSKISNRKIDWILQKEQLGTGHAVLQALPLLNDSDLALILCADIPLIRNCTLENLLGLAADDDGFSILTVKLEHADGYGRIFRDDLGHVVKIVETSDLKGKESGIKECNSGIFAVKAGLLKRWLPGLEKNNAQGELYLTDCVSFASSEGLLVSSMQIEDPSEAIGVNDRQQLAVAERSFQKRVATELLKSGVTLFDPDRIDVRGDLVCGPDVIIDVNVIFIGRVILGAGVYVGPNNVIKNTVIAEDSIVQENCVLDSVSIGSDCKVGPFCRLRPDTILSTGVTIGNFVEIKKTTIGEGSKVNHLSYVGDTEMGRNVNIGAGTITCNFDGENKNKTIIEDRVFVGSNTELVAPLTIGNGATIGAGSTVTKDVEDKALVVSRATQKNISGWKRPKKKKSDG